MSDPYVMACEPACGSPTFCKSPSLGVSNDEWTAFWQRHPSRAGIPTLQQEASQRGGHGLDPRDIEHELGRLT